MLLKNHEIKLVENLVSSMKTLKRYETDDVRIGQLNDKIQLGEIFIELREASTERCFENWFEQTSELVLQTSLTERLLMGKLSV